jgi:hypothetical protein
MAFERREPANKSVGNLGTGLYLAKVISHLDPSYMGSLEVTLQRRQANTLGDDNQTYVVRYASPFFGSTAFEFMGTNKADFNDTQKSYGMWFVPPDVGQTVLVCFVDGSAAEGYWLACIPGRFVNSMVPGIASTTDIELSDEDKKKYAPSTRLPAAEVNKRTNTDTNGINPDIIKKAVHPLADHLLAAGLLDDDVRGTHNSSSRRDIPSMVFGISTPGPLDRRPNAKKAIIGTLLSKTATPVPVSRLGGTQMVFDDGDDQYQRKKPASEGPVEYADILNGEKGEPTIPYGECFRVRTRTGHQILLHNSEDLIYIGNSRGTTWIELTSNGKIDIYSNDSVSIHTENDLNVRAERDINLEAGRNINMKTLTGRIRQEAATNWEILVGQDGKISVGGEYEHVIAGNTKITTSGNLDLRTGGNNKFTAGGNTDIKTGGNHTESAARIDMNSFAAATAEQAQPLEALITHENPATSVSSGWQTRYQSLSISSIMKRVPMHEPWLLHENQAPNLLKPDNTDREQ